MRHNILPEFQNFLISCQWVLEKNVPSYAIWVGNFLSFLNLNRNIKEKSTLLTFLEQLKNQGNVKDWHHAGAPICTALGMIFAGLHTMEEMGDFLLAILRQYSYNH
jgi:hypothetical protein